VIQLRDGRTGALRAEELGPRLGALLPVAGALLLAGRRDDGAPLLAALRPEGLALGWLRAWRCGEVTAAEGAHGVAHLTGPGATCLVRVRDGADLGQVPPVEASAANEESWLGLRAGQLLVQPLRAVAPPALPALPPRPPWLQPGTVLHYLVTTPEAPPRRLSWTLLSADASGLRLRFAGGEAPPREQRWDLGVLRAGRELCVEPSVHDARGSLCPVLLLGSAAAGALRGGEAVRLAWPGQREAPARADGAALHLAAFRFGAEPPVLRHLQATRVRALRANATLEIADYADLPLLLRAEAAGTSAVLVGVAVPAASSGAVSGSASAPGAR
jgi:hypothetical protein